MSLIPLTTKGLILDMDGVPGLESREGQTAGGAAECENQLQKRTAARAGESGTRASFRRG